MNQPDRLWRVAAIALFPLLVALLALVYFDDPYQYLNLVREDSLVEWLSFACLALSGLIALDIGVRTYRWQRRIEWFFFAFGLFCLLMALEEISWGQRIFSLASPEYFLSNSDQQEINVHNVLQQQFDFKTKDLAAVVLSFYGIVLPLLALNRRIVALLQRVGLLVPPLYLIPGFLIATLLMLDVPTGFEEEIGEFLFALCFLLFMLHELLAREMAKDDVSGRLQGFERGVLAARDRPLVLLLTLIAFGLHAWQLDGKGLWLPEAVRAAAAQATPSEIIYQSWQFGVIEQPLWLLLQNVWQPLAGASAYGLRFLPLLAATASVPILWQSLRCVLPGQVILRLFAALLLALAPALNFYAQDASPFALLAMLTTLSLYLTLSLCRKAGVLRLLAWMVVAWLLPLLHLFSLIILLIEAVALAVALFSKQQKQVDRLPAAAILALALLPGLIWAFVAPGTQAMLAAATTLLDPEDWTRADRLERMWKDLTFGDGAWRAYRARLSVALLPLFICGGAVLLLLRRSFAERSLRIAPGLLTWLLLASVLGPALIALYVLPELPTAALIVGLPMLLATCAIGAAYLLYAVPLVGAAAMVLAVALAVTGLVTYRDVTVKSHYQTMATVLNATQQTGDGVLLASPAQHFLADYYLESDNVEIAPLAALSPHWPQRFPVLVPHEVDGQIQDYLRQYPALWVALYDENSVDPGRFLPAYLTAVAYRDNCLQWQDVELCRFVSPFLLEMKQVDADTYLFGDELALEQIGLTARDESIYDVPALLAQLDWHAVAQPTRDYKISLRLVDNSGVTVAQRDDFPIGPLLPPSVWAAGDQKEGYMALPLETEIVPGHYELQLVVYDPVSETRFQPMTASGASAEEVLPIASVEADETGALRISP